MHGFLRPSLVVAASLAACAPTLTAWSSAAAQAQVPELSEADLRELESLLSELGFDPGPVDGAVDQQTLTAIERYQDFASLPGDPVPSPALLIELRGVAAAFSALRNDGQGGTSTPAAASDSTGTADSAGNAGIPAPEAPAEETVPIPPEEPAADPAEKVIVPPPPMPPKLRPLDAAPPQETEPPQLAARPSQNAEPQPGAAPPEPAPASEPTQGGPAPGGGSANPIETELAPYRRDLAEGNLSRDELARQFNLEGRRLLQTANYGDAILKFDVAIFLNPRFAGAYSNRGTAYELLEQRERAVEDFERARQLGFGGVRPPTRENPLR